MTDFDTMFATFSARAAEVRKSRRLDEYGLSSEDLLDLRYSEYELALAAGEDLPWIMLNLLCRQAVTVLAARAGVGKSMFALSVGEAVQGGRCIPGLSIVEEVPSLFIDGEQAKVVIAKRLSMFDLDLDSASILDGRSIDVVRDCEGIADVASDLDCGLVVFDSNRVLNPGKAENDSDEMTQVLQAYQRIAERGNVAVLVLAHSGHASPVRGSTAIQAGADIVVHMDRPSDAHGDRIRLTWVKHRLGEVPSPLSLRRAVGPDGMLSWSLNGAKAIGDDPLVQTAIGLLAAGDVLSANAIANAHHERKGGKCSQGERSKLEKACREGILRRSEAGYHLGDTAKASSILSGGEGVSPEAAEESAPLRPTPKGGARAHEAGPNFHEVGDL